MEQQGLRTGHIVALGGALAALASLWRPWYRLDIPQPFRDAMSRMGSQSPDLLGYLASRLAAALPDRIEASGWQALRGADVVLCIMAIGIVALVLGAAGVFGPSVRIDPGAAARGIAGLAGIGLVVALEHVVNRPGSGPFGHLVHIGGGLWLAVGGCAIALVGGVLAARAAAVGPAPRPLAAFEVAPAPPVDPIVSVAPPAP